MILFKPEHVAPIVLRVKTHTRRRGKPRWRIDAVHQFRTNMPWQDPAGLFGGGSDPRGRADAPARDE